MKVAGFASFIPIVMVSGPLGGYFIGDYLEKAFYPKAHLGLIFSLVGLLASLFEVARLIRAMVKTENDSK